MRRLTTLGILLSLALAGCLQLPDETGAALDDDPEPRTGGTMTAREATSEAAELCREGLLGAGGRFCAVRTVRVDGALRGFDALDVALETFNGDVKVLEAPAGEWGFTVTLEARGDTADAAMRRIDAIDLRWAHEDARGHFVEVVAEHEGQANDLEASIELRMPRGLAMTLVAATSNGDVELAGGRADGLSLTTSNGDIVARGEAAQARLTTSNGDIDATLRPLASARWSLTTSNGDVTLQVPEEDRFGYRFEGTTSNGEVDYTLRDGTKGPCPQGSEYYTPPCNHRTFESRGFDGRPIRVQGMLTTSNGDVNAGPS